ncbi:hypothetical protein ABIC02_007649 [Bradyrhizobium sp. RT5a]
MIEPQVDEVEAITGIDIKVVTADAGYAYAKVYGALERRGIDALIPASRTNQESRSAQTLPVRCEERHLEVPARTYLAPGAAHQARPFLLLKAKDCARCPLKGDCLRVNKAVVVGDHYPALLRARRRRERWSKQDRRLYQRHRWRSEGFHGEAKTWHGLARAIRRGLPNMKIQA